LIAATIGTQICRSGKIIFPANHAFFFECRLSASAEALFADLELALARNGSAFSSGLGFSLVLALRRQRLLSEEDAPRQFARPRTSSPALAPAIFSPGNLRPIELRRRLGLRDQWPLEVLLDNL